MMVGAAIIFILLMGVLGRLSGNGFGAKWGISWLPEVLYCLPFGAALSWAVYQYSHDLIATPIAAIIGLAISYAGMQSATWMFLDWTGQNAPNMNRSSTLKPIIDFIAGRFGYVLGDEGYAWVAAGIKGFIIGLPVGGVLNMILWPFGYEIGSHAKGRVEKYGIDPHAVSEFTSGAFGGVSIVAFIWLVSTLI